MLQVRLANEEGVTRVNPWIKASQERTTSSNLTDMGWVAARADGQPFGRGNSLIVPYVDGREVIVKACGVAMTKLQGQSGTPPLVNGRK